MIVISSRRLKMAIWMVLKMINAQMMVKTITVTIPILRSTLVAWVMLSIACLRSPLYEGESAVCNLMLSGFTRNSLIFWISFRSCGNTWIVAGIGLLVSAAAAKRLGLFLFCSI